MSENTTPADIVRETFAARLKDEIAKRNWNQSDLARNASKQLPSGEELSRDNISNYMRGRALPSPGFLLAIAKALGMTPEQLLPERGQTPPRDVGVLPITDVRDAGGGRAFLRVNKSVSWNAAVRILEILNEEIRRDSAADRISDEEFKRLTDQ